MNKEKKWLCSDRVLINEDAFCGKLSADVSILGIDAELGDGL